MIENAQEFMQKWEKENNPFYPNEMRWDRVSINQMLSAYEKQKNPSHDKDYARCSGCKNSYAGSNMKECEECSRHYSDKFEHFA